MAGPWIRRRDVRSEGSVLVVDDEELIRWSLEQHLGRLGYAVRTAEHGKRALEVMADEMPDLVLLDLRMPELDGMGTLRAMRERGWTVPVIVLTAFGAFETAVESTKLGAVAFLAKPFDLDAVGKAVGEAMRARRSEREIVFVRQQVRSGFDGFIGASAALAPMYETLDRLALVDAPTVLLTGESGTGKGSVRPGHSRARARRKTAPYMEVDCAGLPEHAHRERAVWPRARRVHRRAPNQKRGLFEVAAAGSSSSTRSAR
jgi:two-component system response regulator AtoC